MSMEGSQRSAYVGANVKPGVKRALRDEAGDVVSLSLFISDILEAEMIRRGHVIDERIPDPNERPLPFTPINEITVEPEELRVSEGK